MESVASTQKDQLPTGEGFAIRNAIKDMDHIPSRMVAQGADQAEPLVTIAILTYNRPDFLVEAVKSAMALRFDRPYEIIVVDDEPSPKNCTYLLEHLPEVRERNFRYYIHAQNMGQFPNHNRAIELARGEWMSILHDDDLLDPDWLATMFKEIARRPDVDGLISRKRTLHEHSKIEEYKPPLPRRAAKRLLLESYFLGRESRPLDVRKFFWGAVVGNIAGMLFRRSKALEIGGFYPEYGSAADLWFFARFAKYGRFRQHRAVAATYRVAENVSMTVSHLRAGTREGQRVKNAMIGADVPGWWRHFAPLVVARDMVDARVQWGTQLPREEVEQLTGMPLKKDRPYLLWGIRILLRGF